MLATAASAYLDIPRSSVQWIQPQYIHFVAKRDLKLQLTQRLKGKKRYCRGNKVTKTTSSTAEIFFT